MDLAVLIPVIGIIFGNLIFIAVIVAWWKLRQRRMELQAEVQSKLIERFGSSAELVEFLKSATGREFVHGVQKGSFALGHEKAIGGLRKAIILCFFGAGLVTIWGISGAEWVSWFGVMFLALGLGFLAATYASIRLSRPAEPQTSNAISDLG